MSTTVVVTGGSGFIGLNLTQRLKELGYHVINFDIKPPSCQSLLPFYVCVDINDRESLQAAIEQYNPSFVVNLAARTDLAGDDFSAYQVNIQGVENVCWVVARSSCVKRVLFASSMLVCSAGHIPSSVDDYSARTVYGKSKVEGERIVRSYKDELPSSIVFRPTSIWGPWFDVPYKSFFSTVLAGRYFKIGRKSSTKTYGYVKNAVDQIIFLLEMQAEADPGELLYLGDARPLNVDEWADEICRHAHLKSPKRIPFALLILAAWLGDLLTVFRVRFPLTSFRLRNMTTDNDLSKYTVSAKYALSEVALGDGVDETLNWISQNPGLFRR